MVNTEVLGLHSQLWGGVCTNTTAFLPTVWSFLLGYRRQSNSGLRILTVAFLCGYFQSSNFFHSAYIFIIPWTFPTFFSSAPYPSCPLSSCSFPTDFLPSSFYCDYWTKFWQPVLQLVTDFQSLPTTPWRSNSPESTYWLPHHFLLKAVKRKRHCLSCFPKLCIGAWILELSSRKYTQLNFHIKASGYTCFIISAIQFVRKLLCHSLNWWLGTWWKGMANLGVSNSPVHPMWQKGWSQGPYLPGLI